MPRRGRIHQQAVCYHLYNRCIVRDELFHDERDYARFIQFAARYKQRCPGVKVYHSCLTLNRRHLLVRLPFAMLRPCAAGRPARAAGAHAMQRSLHNDKRAPRTPDAPRFSPYGEADGIRQAVALLGLEHTLRNPGRPEKPQESGGLENSQ